MPRRKKDTLMPLPNELVKQEEKQPETKVEIALQKVKESKKKKKEPILIEYETDDEEPEYTIEPISTCGAGRARAMVPAPIMAPLPPALEPVKKEKRKYTKKVGSAATKGANSGITPPRDGGAMPPIQPFFDIYKQLDTLKRENDRLKTEQSLGHINRLNNMARVMKIKF